MTLINIEYGSLASSETLNKNFLYLDGKITDGNKDFTTSISSILSNIATINTRLNDLAESLSDYVDDFTATLEEYKTKTKILVSMTAMVPNWSDLVAIGDMSDYTVPKNGYLLLTPKNTTVGDLIVNNKAINFKTRTHADDNSSQTVAIPVKQYDKVSSTAEYLYAFFLPVLDVTIEGF